MTKAQYIALHASELSERWHGMDSIEREIIEEEGARLRYRLSRQVKPPTDLDLESGSFDKRAILDWIKHRGTACTSEQLADEFGLTTNAAGQRLRVLVRDGRLRIRDRSARAVTNRVKRPVFELVERKGERA